MVEPRKSGSELEEVEIVSVIERTHHLGLLWLRLLMGAGIASHGYQKLFVDGLEGFAQGVARMGFPAAYAFAFMAAASEFFGGLFIMIGLGTRIAAFFVFATMSVAAFIAHALDPFKVKELALAYLAMSGMLIITGGGRVSVDALFFRRWLNRRRASRAEEA